MKYLMLVCADPDHTPGQDDGAPGIRDWVTEMGGKGVRLMGNRAPGRPTTRPRFASAAARCC